MRFDVPTVGPTTIEMLRRHAATALCIEAGKTLIVDAQDMIALADKYEIVVVGRDSSHHTANLESLQSSQIITVRGVKSALRES